MLAAVTKERDEFKDLALRLQADFENFRKRVTAQLGDDVDRATAKLANLLVPSATQGIVRVSDVAQLKMDHGPTSIQRYNRQRQINLNAALDKASLENERNALWIKTAAGADITCVQVAGLIARRILCYVKAGAPLKRGERYGFIRFGSRVDVYLPLSAAPKVAVGDKVYASSTIIAELG